MTAQIIPFPSRAIDADRLAQAGTLVKQAIPLPITADPQLDMLLQIGGKLLDNLNDYVMPDCSGLIDSMDGWLVQLDRWDAKNAG